jgi:Ankyrin repeats (3 copies)
MPDGTWLVATLHEISVFLDRRSTKRRRSGDARRSGHSHGDTQCIEPLQPEGNPVPTAAVRSTNLRSPVIMRRLSAIASRSDATADVLCPHESYGWQALSTSGASVGSVSELIDADPALVSSRFSELDCGQTAGRNLLLQGGTLLHVAAEYGNPAAVALLLDRGADVNARATVDEAGVGGHTAIFHAVTQFDEGGLPVTQLLVERGADLAVPVKLPGDYERPGEIVECTALGYALLFGGASQRRTVTLLRERGAVE